MNFNRSHAMRQNGMSLHYNDNEHKIREKMEESKKAALPLPPLSKIDSP